MKVNKVRIEDENGEFGEAIDRKEFIAYTIKTLEVEDIQGDTEEDGTITKDEIVDAAVSMVEEGKDCDIDEIQAVYDFVKEKIEASVAHEEELAEARKNEKERKKKEKEEEKARKEAEEKALAKRKDKIAKFFGKGADRADLSFKKELETLKKDLAAVSGGGIEISEGNNHGFALNISAEATDESIGKTIGYFVQKSDNSEFMQHTSGFFVGQLACKMKELGLHKSIIKAAEFIADQYEAAGKKRPYPRGIENYARMHERIPLEYRNPNVPETSYLNISNAKKVNKIEGESKEETQKRSDAYEAERLQIAKDLAEGNLESKDVPERINEMQIKYGVKAAPDPEKKSIGEYLRTYFYCSEYAEHLEGVHEENAVVFLQKGDKDDDQLTYSVAELNEMREEARLNLINALIEYDHLGQRITFDVMQAGSMEIDAPEKDEKGKPTGKTVKETVEIFPRPFWKIEKAPVEVKEEAESSGEEE